ncbi:MAG: acyl-CoA thioesterase [Bacteroidia bacterium]
MKTKMASATYTLKTEMVLPNDTNNLDNLRGGKLMHWIDIIAAIAAQKASNRTVVTASVDNIGFDHPIKRGEIVILEAQVTRAFTTSMEVRVEVHTENLLTGERRKSNEAYLTFVAVDQSGNPIPVNKIEPETDIEKRWFDEALQRREIRLFLSGRLQMKDSEQLGKLFGINL